MLTFLVGGARSGKSTLAVQMGEHFGGPVTLVATAEPFDDELRDRIARHRDERPAAWTTMSPPSVVVSPAPVPSDVRVASASVVEVANAMVVPPEVKGPACEAAPPEPPPAAPGIRNTAHRR